MLHYMIVNTESFILKSTSKQVFMLAVYKHLLKSNKLLYNKKQNNFMLKSWDAYKTCKSYQNLNIKIGQYLDRYKK